MAAPGGVERINDIPEFKYMAGMSDKHLGFWYDLFSRVHVAGNRYQHRIRCRVIPVFNYRNQSGTTFVDISDTVPSPDERD